MEVKEVDIIPEVVNPVVTVGYAFDCTCGDKITVFAGNCPLPYDLTCFRCDCKWKLFRIGHLPEVCRAEVWPTGVKE